MTRETFVRNIGDDVWVELHKLLYLLGSFNLDKLLDKIYTSDI